MPSSWQPKPAWLNTVANGGFQIPVEFQTSVAAQGQSLQQFFDQVEREGVDAVNKIAEAAKQPIKQTVEFEVKDDKLQASLRETYQWTDKIEKARNNAMQNEARRKAKEIADANKVAAANARIAAAEAKARIQRGVAARQGTKFRQQQIRELERIRAETFKTAAATKKLGNAGKRSGMAIVSGFIKAQIAMAALRVGTEEFGRTLNTAFERGNAEKRLQNITGSAAEYEQALRLAQIASADFGMTQTTATKSLGDLYSRLSSVGYGLTEVNDIYTGFNVIARESGVAAEDASGAFLQLSQGLGSGKLAGDELRAILERMPQLTARISEEMGITTGAVKEAGSAGQITGDVIYRALSKAAEGAGDLENKLTTQAMKQMEVARAAEDMRVALGEALTPAYLSIMEGLANAGTILASAFENLNVWVKGNEVALKNFLKMALEVGNIVASVWIVIKVYKTLQLAVAAVAAAKAAFLAMSGVGLAKVAVGAAAAAGVYATLSRSIDGATDEVARLKGESEKELEAVRKKAAETAGAFSEIPEGIDKTIKSVKELEKASDAAAKSRKTAAKGQLQIAKATLAAEKQINDLKLQQAQADLDNARSSSEREAAAKRIHDLTMVQAKLEYDMSMQAINSAVRKQELAYKELEIKRKLIQVEKIRALEAGESVEGYNEALKALDEALSMQKEMVGVSQEVAKQQRRGAEAVYQGAEASAKAAFEQDRVAKSTAKAASSSGTFAKNMEKGAKSAQKAAASAEKAAAASGGGLSSGSSIEVSEEAYQMARNDPKWGSGSVYRQGAVAMELLSKYNKIVQERNAKEAIAEKAEEKRAERIADLEKQKEAEIQETMARAEQSAATVTQINEGGAYETVKILTEGTKRGMEQAISSIENRYAQQFASVRAEGGSSLSLAGARAEGGPVSSGSTYQVNELGREGFLSASGRMSELKVPAWGSWTAPSNGEVIPAHVWAEIKVAGAMGNSSAPAGLAGASRGPSGGPSSIDNSRITNHVTIQSQTPVQTASELMVASAKRRRRRFR